MRHAQFEDHVTASSEPAGFHTGWRGSLRLMRGTMRTLVLGQGVGQLADGLAQVSFAQLVIFDIGRGATPGRIAGVLAATLLPFSVVGPLAGVFIDRWDRRRTLIVTSFCRAALAVAAVGVAVVRSEPLAYVGVLLLLSSSRLVLDAKGAVLPGTVDAADLVRANAISGLVGMTAAFVGAVGGATFVSVSVPAGFAAAAVGYLVASSAFVRLPWVGGGGGTHASMTAGVRRVLREGVAAIATTVDLRRPLLAVWTHRFLLGGGFVLLVLVADYRYHLSTSGYGLAIAVTGVAAFAGTLVAPWLAGRWRPQALLPVAFLPPAAAAVVVGYAPTLAGLLVALAVSVVSFQCLKVLTDALVGRATRDALRGRVFAIYDVLYNVAFVLAGLAMIPLWRAGHEGRLVWWLAAAFAAGWLVLARVTRSWPFSRAVTKPERTAVPDRWRCRVLALLAGALPVVSFPDPALWWFAWFSVVPWLIVLRGAPTAREAAVRGWWGAVGFLLAVHYWLLPSTGPFLLLIVAFLGVLWMPWAATVWGLLRHPPSPGRLAAALLVVPAGWVIVEAMRSWSALGGPWGLLGASQWRAPYLLSPASLGGVWLVSVLIVSVNTVLAGLVLATRTRVRLAAAAVAAALVAAGPLWYLLEPPPAGQLTFDVALVQPGVIHDEQQRLNTEEALTRALPRGRFDLIVWGESSIAFDLFSRPDLQAQLQSLAAQTGSDLLVNVDATSTSGAIEKTAVLIGPQGILSRYEKMRLVPFGEYIPFRDALGWLSDITRAAGRNRSRGSQLVVMHANGVAFAPLICFEIAFPDMSRRAVADGAQLVVYQSATSTFQGSWAPDQQASLAAVRSVETGRPVVQATLTGTSAVFTAQGDRLAWFDTHERGTVKVSVPLASRATPFVRFGDWVLAWSFVVLAAAAIIASLRAAQRTPKPAGRVAPVEEPERPRPDGSLPLRSARG
jgi:apolipoprotein N-acyltransferase